jgi:hypothetical protein
MKSSGKAVAVLVLALAIVACAGHSVRTDFDNSTAFDGFESFAWLEPLPGNVENPLLDSPLFGRKVRQSATAALAERGFIEVDEEAADFLITYHTSVRERLRDSGVSVGFSFGGGYRRGVRSIVVGDQFGRDSYEEGTLMIDIIDARTDELVWRGWTASNVRPDRYTDEAVAEAVRAILAKFPPAES